MLDVPETADELHQALSTIKQQDPGNLGGDLVPMVMGRAFSADTYVEDTSARAIMEQERGQGIAEFVAEEGIKAATIMVATVPILLLYPWLQRYFIRGVMIGAIKA